MGGKGGVAVSSVKTRLIALAAVVLAVLLALGAALALSPDFRWQVTRALGLIPKEEQVPILMYHHLHQEDEPVANAINVDQFEEEMAFLKEEGYTAVSFQELIDYVEEGRPLPRKPVCITFDDGYLSNYELAYPILQKYEMKATIFVIGWSVGVTDYYKDTQYPMTPHFNYEQAKEMVDSGLVSIQTHTYDMHQVEDYETGDKIRRSAVKLPNETEEEYAAALTEDILRARSEIEAATGQPVNVLSYPVGTWDELSESLLKDLGIQVTLTTRPETATLVYGDPDSLRALPRYGVGYDTTLEEFAAMVGEK